MSLPESYRAQTPPTVLVADDNESLRGLLQKGLPPLGFAVKLAKDGSEAVSIIQADEKIDIILMDVEMPTMGGVIAIGKIQTIRKMPCVFMTGGTTVSVAKLLSIGDEVLAKPFGTLEKVADALMNALTRFHASNGAGLSSRPNAF